MDPSTFDGLRRNTNAVESSHHKVNSLGRRQALLAAVILYVYSIT